MPYTEAEIQEHAEHVRHVSLPCPDCRAPGVRSCAKCAGAGRVWYPADMTARALEDVVPPLSDDDLMRRIGP